MTTKQTRSAPVEIQTTGDSQSGNMFFHFRNPGGSVVTVELTPDLVEAFLRNLSETIATSPNQKAKEKGQLFAIRNVSAQTVHDSLITLRYETEVGLTLATSLEFQEATALRDQLDNALSSVPTPLDKKAH